MKPTVHPGLDVRHPVATPPWTPSVAVPTGEEGSSSCTAQPCTASLFGVQRSGYFYGVEGYGVEGLDASLVQNLGAEFIEETEEVAFLEEEPRTLAGILKAEKEFSDKIWYRTCSGHLAGMVPKFRDEAHCQNGPEGA